jgi:hypothetical protein
VIPHLEVGCDVADVQHDPRDKSPGAR